MRHANQLLSARNPLLMHNEVICEPPPPTAGCSRPRIDSSEILRGTNAVEIDHAGQRYILRMTRENKLILTK